MPSITKSYSYHADCQQKHDGIILLWYSRYCC